MNNQQMVTNARPLEDLELFELMVAAYPEKFAAREEKGDDIWDEVMEFADDLCAEMDQDALCALIGRIVMLTMPMQAGITGEGRHALGAIEIREGKALMTAAVSRPFKGQ
jgi:hypothetical protein